MDSYPNRDLSHRPQAAEGLEGFVNAGQISGSGDGQLTDYAILRDGSLDLDGSAIRRLGNGLMVVSDIFLERSDSEESEPPSQAEAILFMVEAEHQAHQRLSGALPVFLTGRRQLKPESPSEAEQNRQKRLAATEERLSRLGFSLDPNTLRLNLRAPKEPTTE